MLEKSRIFLEPFRQPVEGKHSKHHLLGSACLTFEVETGPRHADGKRAAVSAASRGEKFGRARYRAADSDDCDRLHESRM